MLISSGLAKHEKGVSIEREPNFQHWTCAYLYDGALEFHLKGRVLLVDSPSFFVIPCNLDYRFVVDRDDEHLWALFSPETLGSNFIFSDDDISIVKMNPTKNLHHKEIAEAMTSCFHWWNRSPARLALADNALERAILLTQEVGKVEAHGPVDHRIDFIRAYIDKNLRQNLDNQHLAKLVHLSPSRFASLFKEHVRTTPAKYVEGKRMAAAADLLIQDGTRINQIAEMVGYPNPFHFSKRFRALFGQSPRDFRRSPKRNRYEIKPTYPKSK